MSAGFAQRVQRCGGVDCLRTALLAQLLAGFVDHHWHVQVRRRGQAQQVLQVDLARRGVEQIGPAHDMGDALRGVIHHHGELIGPQAVRAAQDEVAEFRFQVLALAALPAVVEADRRGRAVRHAHPPRARQLAVQAVAASAGVAERLVAFAHVDQRVGNFLA
ncbi:hypothetical protein D3C87_1247790 [compost metagenome]